ncbi:MAG: hypothetical protein Q7V31_03540 [Parvibaculum sp.]|uniref:hypothetical protein n=1 Tax=Parvibaculum sp. TaxID=2024848 RepID=UPI002720471F|nr:hypothetical protein [Parvibaculum sp.]MDO8837975.1 hypothetical protein [Parvibaculum sp.]
MKMHIGALAVLATLLTPAGVAAGTLNGTHFACLTKPALDEIHEAGRKRDTRQGQALLDNLSCVVLKPGQEFSVIERGLFTSKIRVYAGGGSVPLYVSSKVLDDVR